MKLSSNYSLRGFAELMVISLHEERTFNIYLLISLH